MEKFFSVKKVADILAGGFDLGEFALFTSSDGAEKLTPGLHASGLLVVDEDLGDWLEVRSFANIHDNTPRAGWMKAWILGDPFTISPGQPLASLVTRAAARLETDPEQEDRPRVRADMHLALLLIANGLQNESTDLKPGKRLKLKDERVGGYGVSDALWDAFIAARGGDGGVGARSLVTRQMQCVDWRLRNDYEAFAERGTTSDQPAAARAIDLFLAWLLGVDRAVALAQREQNEEELDIPLLETLRDDGMTDQQINALTLGYAELVDEAEDVQEFLRRCRAALLPALTRANDMLLAYAPKFLQSDVATAQGWFQVAKQLETKWAGPPALSENANPGQDEALSFFADTDHGPGRVTNDPEPGEITHWCGAFVAHCVKAVNLEPPAGAARAANWATWGDVGFKPLPNADIPEGAVVTIRGSKKTNRITHVTLFAGWEAGGGRFKGLGGNQSDTINTASYATSTIAAIRSVSDKTQVVDEDVDVLARTLWGEIRGGDEAQRRNVADVVLNRFLSGYRSNGSIRGVCLYNMQFSCWNPGTTARTQLMALTPTSPHMGDLLALAAAVIADRQGGNGPKVAALTDANHYHAHTVNPNWAIPGQMTHDDGKHKFYVGIA